MVVEGGTCFYRDFVGVLQGGRNSEEYVWRGDIALWKVQVYFPLGQRL